MGQYQGTIDGETRAQALPVLLRVVVAALGVVAAYLLVPTITALRAGFELFAYSPAFGALDIAVGLLIGIFSVAFARIGYGLYEGSRVCRGLAFVLVADFLVVALVSDLQSAVAVLLALASLGVVALLALAPSVRAFFAGPWAVRTELPTSIVVAHFAVLLASGTAGLFAAVLLVAGMAGVASSGEYVAGPAPAGASLIVAALLSAIVAGGGFWARAVVGVGHRSARILLTVAAVLDLVLVAVISTTDESTLPFVAALVLHTAAVVALWLPTDARLHFADGPLALLEDLHRRVLTMSASAGPDPVPPVPPEALGGSRITGPPLPTPRPFVEPSPSGRHARPDPSSCTGCGHGLQPGWRVCPHCGSPVAGGPAYGQRA